MLGQVFGHGALATASRSGDEPNVVALVSIGLAAGWTGQVGRVGLHLRGSCTFLALRSRLRGVVREHFGGFWERRESRW